MNPTREAGLHVSPTEPSSFASAAGEPTRSSALNADEGSFLSLPAETATAVDVQAQRFIDSLLNEDLASDSFQQRLDSAFRLGREEISLAAGLMQGRFMQRNFVSAEDSPAYKAIARMRGHLDALNPGRAGDLLAPRRLLGVIPMGDRLQAYFRKFQSAGDQMQQALQQLYAARDELQRDVVEIESVRARLVDALVKLAAAIRLAEQLDATITQKIAALKATDAARAQALEQEVLFYVRQNLQDMRTQQAVCVNGALSLDVLKRTGREMINGCTRVATTGMSALAVAQTVARATGNQVQVMNMLSGVSASIEELIGESGRQLGQHVERTREFAANPLLGIERMKEMFDQTFKAMDAMDTFRAKALETMERNNALLREQIERSEAFIDRGRHTRLRHAAGAIDGPVALS